MNEEDLGKQLFSWDELRAYFLRRREASRDGMERAENSRQYAIMQGRAQVWTALLNLPHSFDDQ